MRTTNSFKEYMKFKWVCKRCSAIHWYLPESKTCRNCFSPNLIKRVGTSSQERVKK